MQLRYPTVFLFLCAAAACSSSASHDAATTEAASTQGRALTTIKGREWARCWFDVTGNDAQLSCTSTARGVDPLGATVEVTAAGMGDLTRFASLKKKLDIEQGETVVVGAMPRAAFPVILMLHATFTREALAAIGETQGIDLWSKPTIPRPEDLPAARPQVFVQPFDLWEVAFVDGTESSRGFRVRTTEYTRAIAPYEGFLNERAMKIAPSFASRGVQGQLRYFVAPTSGSVALTVTAGGEAPATLDRPGYYAVTSSGLRAATAEEVARDFPRNPSAADAGASPSPSADAGPPDAPAAAPMADAATTDAAPGSAADPDPTCGAHGQPRCASGACDPGTRYDADGSTCVACGDPGLTHCFRDPKGVDSNSGWRCNSGSRYDFDRSSCVPCGGAGQTYCLRDANGVDTGSGWQCSAGTRYDFDASRCVHCGNEGQTYCYRDAAGTNASSGWVCNAGLRLDSATSTCVR